MQDDFKKAVHDIDRLLWYGLPEGTDLWQPVDAGYAACLKSLIAIEHRNWLDKENNAEKWFNNEKPYTAKERRISITQWTGKAWEKLSSCKYDSLRLHCWMKTGCLITADGSDDVSIKPEGLSDYQVPPPALINAMTENGESNMDTTPISTRSTEAEKVNQTPIIDGDELFASDEDNGQRNVFDFIDKLLLNRVEID